jgi:hypothetical protein
LRSRVIDPSSLTRPAGALNSLHIPTACAGKCNQFGRGERYRWAR